MAPSGPSRRPNTRSTDDSPTRSPETDVSPIEIRFQQLQTSITTRLDTLFDRIEHLTPQPTIEPTEDTPTVAYVAQTTQPITIPTYKKPPQIPNIDKLKGRYNFQTWSTAIEQHAKLLQIWPIYQSEATVATEQQETLALSLIILNLSHNIQSQFRVTTSAYHVW